MTREVIRYKLNELRMMLNDGEHGEEQGILVDIIKELDKAENKGEWIYDKGINNWRCSRCGQTPPPTGYVGKADFMATHFKFCNHCGADMREPKGEKGTE